MQKSCGEGGIAVVTKIMVSFLRRTDALEERKTIARCGVKMLSSYLVHADDQQIDAFKITDISGCFIKAFDLFHRNDKSIGKFMVKAFTRLLCVQSTERRQQQLADVLTAKRIIEAMRHCGDDAGIQCDGIWCLEYISDLKRKEIADEGGFAVIVKAMRK